MNDHSKDGSRPKDSDGYIDQEPISFLDALNENGVDFNFDGALQETPANVSDLFAFSLLRHPVDFEAELAAMENASILEAEQSLSQDNLGSATVDNVPVSQHVQNEQPQSSLISDDTKLEVVSPTLRPPFPEVSPSASVSDGRLDGDALTAQSIDDHQFEFPSISEESTLDRSTFENTTFDITIDDRVINDATIGDTSIDSICTGAAFERSKQAEHSISAITTDTSDATSSTNTVGTENLPNPVSTKRKREPSMAEMPHSSQDSSTTATSESSPSSNLVVKKHKGKDIDQLKKCTTLSSPDRDILLHQLEQRTYEYQGYIQSHPQASFILNAYENLSSQDERFVSNPETDRTFPQNTEDYKTRIRELFEAICDWSNRREWRARMGPRLVKAWIAEVTALRKTQGLEINTSNVEDDLLVPPANRMPPIDEQWMNVVHRKMSDIEIELLCSQILRQAVLAQKGENLVPLWSGNDTQWEEYGTFGER
ncbi:Fc.00g093480.m01.CDS01 [Cosmosporella sp. VM-42]